MSASRLAGPGLEAPLAPSPGAAPAPAPSAQLSWAALLARGECRGCCGPGRLAQRPEGGAAGWQVLACRASRPRALGCAVCFMRRISRGLPVSTGIFNDVLLSKKKKKSNSKENSRAPENYKRKTKATQAARWCFPGVKALCTPRVMGLCPSSGSRDAHVAFSGDVRETAPGGCEAEGLGPRSFLRAPQGRGLSLQSSPPPHGVGRWLRACPQA